MSNVVAGVTKPDISARHSATKVAMAPLQLFMSASRSPVGVVVRAIRSRSLRAGVVLHLTRRTVIVRKPAKKIIATFNFILSIRNLL